MKNIIIFTFFTMGTNMFAQNFQVHYEMHEDRKYFVGTLEMLKTDDLGSIFWFVDIEYNDRIEEKSASLAYWEIARMFNIPTIKDLTVGLQYNDGLDTSGGLGNIWLVGVEYPIDLKFITLVTSIWYRDAEFQDPNLQATVVWFKPLMGSKMMFTGYFDLWGQRNFDFDAQEIDLQWVLLTEPQLWYSLSKKISIGGEVEISKNFIFGAGDKLKIYPTLGVKWDF